MINANPVILLPLDERPVNWRLPQEIGLIAGATVHVPPLKILPAFRKPASPTSLRVWLEHTLQMLCHTSIIASIDMIAYGGLIPSRASSITPFEAIRSVEHIKELARSNKAVEHMIALSTIMRAPAYNNAAEEPAYWATYGTRLHNLGIRIYDRFATELDHSAATKANPIDQLEPDVPDHVLRDYERRRLRNHLVNMFAVSSLSGIELDALFLTVDDSAPRSANALEQQWAQLWIDASGYDGKALTYAGADETACTALARICAPMSCIQVWFIEPGDVDRIAKFENQSLGHAVNKRASAMNATIRIVTASSQIDPSIPVLIIHAPDDRNGDHCNAQVAGTVIEPTAADIEAAHRTCEAAVTLMRAGTAVGIADLRYANGGDTALISALAATGHLEQLAAYAGWNTAGNALGTAMATLAITAAAKSADKFNACAAATALVKRLIEDVTYQTNVRFLAMQTFNLTPDALFSQAEANVTEIEAFVQQQLNQEVNSLQLSKSWHVTNVRFPWNRLFEIDFDVKEKEESEYGRDA